MHRATTIGINQKRRLAYHHQLRIAVAQPRGDDFRSVWCTEAHDDVGLQRLRRGFVSQESISMTNESFVIGTCTTARLGEHRPRKGISQSRQGGSAWRTDTRDDYATSTRKANAQS